MNKIIRAICLLAAPAVLAVGVLAGCKGKPVELPVNEDGLLLDKDTAPGFDAAYTRYSAAALEEYLAVAQSHTVDGDVDFDDEEVAASAKTAAAKLYAYACYNERTLDKYVYFGNQEGYTTLSATSGGKALRQEYYLRVNESEETCGYRFHYTIKKVLEASGTVSTFKSSFESARIRMTDKTNLLYRFEGDNLRVGEADPNLGYEMLECDWATGSDWGVPDIEMVKSDYIAPENIAADIEAHAGEDNITMRGNINILAENIVKGAYIYPQDDGGALIVMTIDTDVANGDAASLKMLRKGNGSDNCRWVADGEDESDTGLSIMFYIWGNGLFRFYTVQERWTGKIAIFTGTAESTTTVCYSYSDRDCDMAGYLQMLEAAKNSK